MYPLHHYRLFAPYPVENRVFVAMDFSPKFDARWKRVIEPAIQAVKNAGKSLMAHRVDTSQVSASLLSEILDGIGRELLVFADITTLHVIDSRPLRNANVLYELGIAHAVRLPEENLVFRSDGDTLPFDVANIRVNSYQPDDDPDAARSLVTTAIESALQSINEQRRVSVERAAEMLDAHTAVLLLFASANPNEIRPIVPRTYGDHASHYARSRPYERLLEIGALRTIWPNLDPDPSKLLLDEQFASLARYEITPFGRAVARRISETVAGNLTEQQLEQLVIAAEQANR